MQSSSQVKARRKIGATEGIAAAGVGPCLGAVATGVVSAALFTVGPLLESMQQLRELVYPQPELKKCRKTGRKCS